jgi:hypothetical protein
LEITMERVSNASQSLSRRLLVVADWELDGEAVMSACVRRCEQRDVTMFLLLPAWLHGADWAGDPFGSVPCARRALTELATLCRAAGLRIDSAEIGDPDPTAAVIDVVLSQSVDELLLCVRDRRLGSHPFDLAHRLARNTGLPVERVGLPKPGVPLRHRRWSRLRNGHCIASATPAMIAPRHT